MTSQRMAQISREEAFPLKGPRKWTSIRPTSTGMRGTTMAKRGMRRWVTLQLGRGKFAHMFRQFAQLLLGAL